jgi:hypothetical protein
VRKLIDAYTVVDANLNRSREGLRVCEDICRFVWRKQKLAQTAKELRHRLTEYSLKIKDQKLLNSRDISKDEGKPLQINELNRANWDDLFKANVQRAKEACRVLEEVSKICEPTLTASFKAERFRIYEFEKKALIK